MERRFGPVGGIWKRAFDCALALIALVIMSPIMFMTALLIAIAMGRPIFSTQQSIGFNGSRFARLKFRTAMLASETRDGLTDLPQAAPCISCVGRMLRDSGLDGLPQLLNVIRGDMSFIGPQCLPSSNAALHRSHEKHYAKARPGLTGLWQAMGSQDSMHSRQAACDGYYVRCWSPSLDAFIAMRAVLNAGKRRPEGFQWARI